MRIEFIERYPIAALTPADYNPRKLAEDKFLKLQESIRRFGVIKPVIVNGDNGILTAGHQRTRAMIALGMTHCPAVRINGITQVDEIRFNLFHNSVETNKSKARVCGNLSAGQYHIVQPDHLSYEKMIMRPSSLNGPPYHEIWGMGFHRVQYTGGCAAE